MNRLVRLLLAPFEPPEVSWHVPDDVVTWDNIRPTNWSRIVTTGDGTRSPGPAKPDPAIVPPAPDPLSTHSPYQQGRYEERAAIVAYLQAQGEGAHSRYQLYWYGEAADVIVTGEHLKPSR